MYIDRLVSLNPLYPLLLKDYLLGGYIGVRIELIEMVSNKHCVLDEGVFKPIPEVKEMKYDSKLLTMWRSDALTHHVKMVAYCDRYTGCKCRENYCFCDKTDKDFPERGKSKWFDNSCMNWDFPYDVKPRYRDRLYEQIMKHYDWKPFIPFLTFNISPNWAGCKLTGAPAPWRIELLKETIRKFFAISNRFSQVDYAIECGSEGNHLHAHVVAQISADQQATVITQLHKGNLVNGFRKIWLKQLCEGQIREGMGGIMKGKFAIQTGLFRKEEFLRDKLNYLDEDKKPDDHKNLRDLGERETIYF
jgi:hypothetical protein